MPPEVEEGEEALSESRSARPNMQKIRVIDSHTGGEPTRVVVSGGPDLGSGSIPERQRLFRERHDRFRSAVVNEPRGSEVIVGALVLPPVKADSAAAVVFFNNVGTIGMCGHGTIGLVATLSHLGRVQPGGHRIETSVGEVTARLHADGRVSVRNVASRRTRKAVSLDVPGFGVVAGDVAWGGNWFFLVSDHRETLALSNIERLTEVTRRIRQALPAAGITGDDGGEIDHIELFGPPQDARNQSRNFVLCPGGAYDRSPCGTGTSAKLACLYADGKLRPGEVWRQESVIGSVFEGSVEIAGGEVIPTVTGRAWVTSEAELLLCDDDPFIWGIRP